MHNQNIIHRDIKLENILLRDSSDERSIVIADFGLATKIDNPKQILFKRFYNKLFLFFFLKCKLK